MADTDEHTEETDHTAEPVAGPRRDIGPDDLPDAAAFWRWAGRSTRPYVGWILIALGVIAILVGYFGVSREALVAKQIPYLVSGGIGGMVLVAVGAFFLGTEDLRRELSRLERIEGMVDRLHGLLLQAADDPSDNGSKKQGGTTRARARRSGSASTSD